MEESQSVMLSRSSQTPKGFILSDSICMTSWQRENSEDGQHQWLLRTRGREGVGNKGAAHGNFGGLMKLFYLLIVVVVTQQSAFIKTIELYRRRGEFYCL